jgi:uncharacterized membrane protein
MKNDNAKLKISILFVVLIFFIQFIIVNHAFAADESTALIKNLSQNCQKCGNCELTDFVKIAFWVWQWILGISGSLALAFFIYGGFTFLISGGSSERVTKGKTILINSVIGLVIIFCSFMIVNFILTSTDYYKKGDWFNPPTSANSRSCPSSSGTTSQ